MLLWEWGFDTQLSNPNTRRASISRSKMLIEYNNVNVNHEIAAVTGVRPCRIAQTLKNTVKRTWGYAWFSSQLKKSYRWKNLLDDQKNSMKIQIIETSIFKLDLNVLWSYTCSDLDCRTMQRKSIGTTNSEALSCGRWPSIAGFPRMSTPQLQVLPQVLCHCNWYGNVFPTLHNMRRHCSLDIVQSSLKFKHSWNLT